MAEKLGVKETKEALLACVVLGVFVAERAKDGLQLADGLALVDKLKNDPDFINVVKAGIDGIDKVPAEVKDFSLSEALEVAAILPDLLKLLGK